jgi:hypothetical protein
MGTPAFLGLLSARGDGGLLRQRALRLGESAPAGSDGGAVRHRFLPPETTSGATDVVEASFGQGPRFAGFAFQVPAIRL